MLPTSQTSSLDYLEVNSARCYRLGLGGLLGGASSEHPIYSGLGAKLSSFACAILPGRGPIAQRSRALELALTHWFDYDLINIPLATRRNIYLTSISILSYLHATNTF